MAPSLKKNTTALLPPNTECAESSVTRGTTRRPSASRASMSRALACIRCPVKRAIRIDVLTGDRLGSGGYDYHDAAGLPAQAWRAPDGRRAVGIAARRDAGPLPAPPTGWVKILLVRGYYKPKYKVASRVHFSST
jgi:hypothetical protein